MSAESEPPKISTDGEDESAEIASREGEDAAAKITTHGPEKTVECNEETDVAKVEDVAEDEAALEEREPVETVKCNKETDVAKVEDIGKDEAALDERADESKAENDDSKAEHDESKEDGEITKDEWMEVVNNDSDLENIESSEENISRDMELDDSKEGMPEEKKVNVVPHSSGRQAPKRRISETVITISDSDSDDSSVCHVVNSYLASPTEAKRLRGDYSSDTYSSDSYPSDEDDSITVDQSTKALVEMTPNTFCLRERASRLDNPKLNECFSSAALSSDFESSWQNEEDFESPNVRLRKEPFKFCILENFLADEKFINNIVDDMYTLEWSRKKMDLYEYHQTSDLANISWQRGIKGVYDLLKTEVMPWIAKITRTTLTTISASGSFYGTGDHLLVHDDLLGDRKIAFILYLLPWEVPQQKPPSTENSGAEEHSNNTENSTDIGSNGQSGSKDPINVNSNIKGWADSLGGSLELFTTNAEGHPESVARRIIPSNNMFAFFEVSKKSFHQVAEVTSFDFPRLTINGWFHGPIEDIPDTEEEITKTTEVSLEEPMQFHRNLVFLDAWITSQYLMPRTMFQIQQQIESASEISLESFLKDPQYEALLLALQDDSLEWKQRGPPNQKNYEYLTTESLDLLPFGNALRGFTQVLTSAPFSQMLFGCTDLSLKTYSNISVQRWSAGCYSVLPPKEDYCRSELDLVLYLGCAENSPCGGSTVYIAPEDTSNDPLVTLEPRNNALNIVYADQGTANFTRYVSRLALEQKHFYIIRCTYRE